MKVVASIRAAANLCLVVPALLAWVSSAAAQQPPKPQVSRQLVAVLDFDALGASKIEASAITDQVREGLLSRAGYRIVDRAQMDKVMSEQALQQEGCTTQDCAVQVGKILGVRKLVTGKVTKVGNLWVLTANLIDVETAETLKAVSVQSEGDFRAALTGGSAGLVAKLADSQATAAAAPTVAAAPTEPSTPRDPRQGFTVYGGLRSEGGTLTFKPPGSAKPEVQVAAKSNDAVVRPTSGTAKLSAVGIALGGDYQWVLAPEWTITVFLEGYSGSVSGDLADLYDQLSGSNLGTEVRYWFAADKYIGGGLMSHGETLTPSEDAQRKYKLKPVTASRGSTVALAGGWEVRPRFSLGASLEIGSATFANADYGYGALKVTAAYRWPYPTNKP